MKYYHYLPFNFDKLLDLYELFGMSFIKLWQRCVTMVEI